MEWYLKIMQRNKRINVKIDIFKVEIIDLLVSFSDTLIIHLIAQIKIAFAINLILSDIYSSHCSLGNFNFYFEKALFQMS